jgi:hypothetical protein
MSSYTQIILKPGGQGRMRRPVKMITTLRMQNIMEIRKENNLFRDRNPFFKNIYIMQPRIVSGHGLVRKTTYFVTKSFFHKCLTICHLPPPTAHLRSSNVRTLIHKRPRDMERQRCICIYVFVYILSGSPEEGSYDYLLVRAIIHCEHSFTCFEPRV